MKKHKKAFVNILYVIVMLLSICCTVVAALNDKSDGGSDWITYATLYGLVLLPPVALSAIVKFVTTKYNEKIVTLGDAMLMITSVIVVIVLGVLGSVHDIKLIIPWCLILLFEVFIINIKRKMAKQIQKI